MYCRNCGERIRSDKCGLCGASLEVNAHQKRMVIGQTLNTVKTSNVAKKEPEKNDTETELIVKLLYAVGVLGGMWLVLTILSYAGTALSTLLP